jgi:hypothetical protein
MSESETRRWTQVDRGLYADHIRKLNTPRPAQGPAYRDAPIGETLRDYRTVLQDVALLKQSEGELAALLWERLSTVVNLQMDYLTGLHHAKNLDTADMFHDGPVLAIKIKNLKKIPIREDPPDRDFIYRALARKVLMHSRQGFAGFYSRIYVLLESVSQAHVIVRHLDSDLNRLVEPLVLEGIPTEDIPYVLCGIGRTWQEAKLVTRGALSQEQVPLALE